MKAIVFFPYQFVDNEPPCGNWRQNKTFFNFLTLIPMLLLLRQYRQNLQPNCALRCSPHLCAAKARPGKARRSSCCCVLLHRAQGLSRRRRPPPPPHPHSKEETQKGETSSSIPHNVSVISLPLFKHLNRHVSLPHGQAGGRHHPPGDSRQVKARLHIVLPRKKLS